MDYNFTELIDICTLKSFFDSFFKATEINCSIIDVNGNELLGSGNKEICSKFHQVNSQTSLRCSQTKFRLLEEIRSGKQYAFMNCPNGLTSIGIPINISGQLHAMLYFGQFLLKPPSLDYFKKNCSIFAFDEGEYLKSLNSVTIISVDRMNSIIKLLIRLCNVIGKLGYDSLQELQWNCRLTDNYMELESTYEELVATEEELRSQFDKLQVSQEKLRQSEERYKLALLGSHDGIWDWDILNNSYYYSDKWADMLGYTKETLPLSGSSWRSLIHPDDLVIFDREINGYINKFVDRYKCEYRMKTRDGKYIWVSDVGAATWNEEGLPIRMVGSHTDITEQKNTLEEIHRLAYYDNLTGFPNKYSLYQKLKRMCSGQEEFSVIFMDLDNFKSVNDILSHTFGDSFLRNLSIELSSFIDNNCSIYRWGGDEFVFILKGVKDSASLSVFLDSLVKLLNSPLVVPVPQGQ